MKGRAAASAGTTRPREAKSHRPEYRQAQNEGTADAVSEIPQLRAYFLRLGREAVTIPTAGETEQQQRRRPADTGADSFDINNSAAATGNRAVSDQPVPV
ncbi:hypothetical protein NtRootA1_19280 [Arthrobacter sp. NtRootA1]|nr:hypothetical protein NtRootA1_19280 [Arthrobacter sp. NtRootA1]